MRDGHAWSGSESNDLAVPSSFRGSSVSLEQTLGLYEAAFCAAPQPLSDYEGAMPPSLEELHDEKQALPTQIDSTFSGPPLKRARRSLHSTTELTPRRAGRPSKSLHQKTPLSEVQSEQSNEKVEKSSSEECTILPQHHELPCVRAEC